MEETTPEVVEPTTEPVEQTQDAPVVEPTTTDEQHAADETTQPTPEPETPVEPEEPEEDDKAPQVQALTPVDPKGFVDASGVFDIDGYAQAMIANQEQTVAAATSQMRAEIEYKGQWDKAVEKYPELKEAKIRDMIAAIHIQQSQNGKYISPEKAAKQFFDLRDGKALSALEEGKREATETTRVQASAHVETSGGTSKSAGTVSDLKTQLSNATSNGQRSKLSQQILKELIQSGHL